MTSLILTGLLVLVVAATYRYTYLLEYLIAPSKVKRQEISQKGFWWDNHYCFDCCNFSSDCGCCEYDQEEDDEIYDYDSADDDTEVEDSIFDDGYNEDDEDLC